MTTISFHLSGLVCLAVVAVVAVASGVLDLPSSGAWALVGHVAVAAGLALARTMDDGG
jgi:hypothetical protein